MNSQTKTTILLLTAFFSIILSFSVYVYYAVSNYSYEDFNKLLEIRALTAAKSELEDVPNTDVEDIRNTFFEKLPHEQDYFYPLNENVNFKEEANKLQIPLSFFEDIIKNEKAEFNNKILFFKGIKYNSPKGDYIVIASAENYFELYHSQFLKKTLFFAILAALIFSFIISLYFSKYFFKPLHVMTEKVNQISTENLHLRLSIDDNNDELNVLSKTFNNMLDRIETSFETQNNFISNASHELRTPLTAIIGEADVTLSKIRTIDEYIETIKIILDEAEKLDKKTKALLFLAQTGFNGKIQKFEKVRVDQLLFDVKETIEKINPKNKVHIDTSLLPENPIKLKVKGSEQLLHLAFSNIISNGCKYSNFRPVTVSIGATDKNVFVIIKDVGIGIPSNELKHIYDPFFRASNTGNYEGYGIGLPLTQNIIRMHNGEIIVSSIQNQGTTVQINLPIGDFEMSF
jgi:signal transduction histidine kinase